MRNWPLFLSLGGLIFFFYFLYVYQAQSTEYSRGESSRSLSQVVITTGSLRPCGSEGDLTVVDLGIGLLLARLPDGSDGLVLNLGGSAWWINPSMFIADRHPRITPSRK
uniref:Beta-lactamase domain-containing protein n=1 Tax=Angiostrongylus cantonensis TaxID=6313 RepID=A0A0K0DN31_ANGCA